MKLIDIIKEINAARGMTALNDIGADHSTADALRTEIETAIDAMGLKTRDKIGLITHRYNNQVNVHVLEPILAFEAEVIDRVCKKQGFKTVLIDVAS